MGFTRGIRCRQPQSGSLLAVRDRIALIKDLDRETIYAMLEDGKALNIGDRFLELFISTHRRGAQSWDESRAAGKGRSKERGEKFMLEIDEVLKHVEAIT